jgi:hypothetical protein
MQFRTIGVSQFTGKLAPAHPERDGQDCKHLSTSKTMGPAVLTIASEAFYPDRALREIIAAVMTVNDMTNLMRAVPNVGM